MMKMTPRGDRSNALTISIRPAGRPARLTKFEKISAPNRMKKSFAVVIAVSRSTWNNAPPFSAPRRQAMASAPAAPMPDASVGVNMPA